MMRWLLILVLFALPACSPTCLLEPKSSFDDSKLASAPDYGESEAWAAHPERDDKADMTPPGVEDRQDEAKVDVFFIHPTTWFDREVWNAPLDAEKAREIVDEVIMSGQASAFNGCCRVFAPRYRQAMIGAFLVDSDDAEAAFEVAYEDVRRAFEVFLDEHSDGRPFILASHSQGSLHAMGLLEEIDADAELRERLVAAYIPGFAHPMQRFEEAYEHLEPCESPTQTGCVVAWDTYREGADASRREMARYWNDGKLASAPEDTTRQCTNPITWRADGEASQTDQHRGAVPTINDGEESSFWSMMVSDEPIGLDITGLDKPREGLVTARCDDGVLRVPDLDDVDYEALEMAPGNYHLLDYELFYMDVRHNARQRAEAWLEADAAQSARSDE
ncbi:MAG: DUF3089 domain-containing protein [Persicimonas sp.]